MKFFHSFTTHFLNKRIPAASQHRLDHKNIFIFPSKFGGLFLGLCALLFLLGTNYQNNLMLMLCYFLLAMFLVNLLASYINFARIHLQQGKSSQVFVGDNLPMPLWLNSDNKSLQDTNGLLYFRFRDEQNGTTSPTNKVDGNAFSNPVTLSYACHKRGKLTLPRVTVTSYYPLGLFRCWTHLAFDNEIIVYPKPLPCSVSVLTQDTQSFDEDHPEKQGQVMAEQVGYDDFSHLKAYQAGEPLHHVAWKQLAKGRGMVSKHFANQTQQIGWLKLSDAARQGRLPAEQLETEISHLTYQVIELSRQQQLFGLDLGKVCIAPNQGSGHNDACLKALALYQGGAA